MRRASCASGSGCATLAIGQSSRGPLSCIRWHHLCCNSAHPFCCRPYRIYTHLGTPRQTPAHSPGPLGGIAMPDKRILLVEDEPEIRQLLSHTLRAEGYVVDAAATAAEAWALLNAHAYTSVITDWRLPDGDGVLIADWAADQGGYTFVMSGYLFQMPGGRAERHQTLMKPIRPSEIVAAVERSIGKAGVG